MKGAFSVCVLLLGSVWVCWAWPSRSKPQGDKPGRFRPGSFRPGIYRPGSEEPDSSQSGPINKPNIIFIMPDDLGWNDVGYHNPKVRTPNIDKLAAKGIELTQNYVLPVCSASRAALMTGRYPSRNGLQHFVVQGESQTCLPVELKTIGDYMRAEGYVTNMVGKWHLGYCNDQCLPRQRGFDQFRGILGGECDYFTWEEGGVMVKYTNDEPETANLGTHLTIQDANDISELIRAHKESPDPFFMVVTPTAPHTPLQPTESMYNVHDFLDPNNNATRLRREFLGLVSAVDDLVGSTVQALEDAGMSDNTIIVFQSDNGGSSIEPPVPGFTSVGNNYPLRNGKFSFHEGGIKAQSIYYDPRLPDSTRGTKRNFMMHVSDWIPTFVELAGGRSKLPGLDGISQASNLGNEYAPDQDYRVRDHFLVGLDTLELSGWECANRDSAFRWQDWKLLYGKRSTLAMKEDPEDEYAKPVESPELPTITGDPCQKTVGNETVIRCLFNIRDDPSETKDLYGSRPDIVRKLRAMIFLDKLQMVHPVFSQPLGITPETTRQLGDLIVPRHDYCVPEEHFPLKVTGRQCIADNHNIKFTNALSKLAEMLKHGD